MITRAARHTVRVLITTAGILLILIAVLSATVRLGLPLLAGYKGEVETRVSEYLKSPVDIGELSLRWKGFGPLLHAQSVAVLESEQRQVTLDELLIDLNLFKSLMRGAPVINELTLVGANLAIEADTNGSLRVHGMEPARVKRVTASMGKAASSGKGVDVLQWLLSARKVGLLDTQITLIDVQADTRLIVNDLNIRAQNDGQLHQLRVDLQLPEELGGTLEAGIDLVGAADSLSSSDGDLYLRGDTLEVKALSELLSIAGLLDIERNALAHIDTSLSLELWGTWEDGKLVSVRGPLTTGVITHAVTGQTVIDKLSAELVLNAFTEHTVLSAHNLEITAADSNSRLDQLVIARSKHSDTDQPAISVTVASEVLPLDAITALSQTLLIQSHPALSTALSQINPSGQVDNLNVTLAYSAEDSQLDMTADLVDVSTHAYEAVPGLGPISGRINIKDSVGELSVTGQAMALPWPAYTHETLTIESLSAAITLDAQNLDRILVNGDIALTDQGIDTSTRFKATLIKGQSPHLDLQSRYTAADITALKRWLPRKKMGVGAQLWADQAIEGGAATNGSLLFFGRLSEFPFDESEGVFRASVDINDGQLRFLPDWPTATGVNGTLDLNGLMLTGTAGLSKLNGFDITQTNVRINNLVAPVLHMQGSGQGELQSIIDFANQGPLQSFLQPVLGQVTGTGTASMDLTLTAPLYRPNPVATADDRVSSADTHNPSTANADEDAPLFAIDGSIFLRENNVTFGIADMPFKSVQGAIGFDQHGIRVNNLRARMLEQPVLINALTDGQLQEATTRVTVSGALESSDVLSHYGNPLDQFIRGASGWNLELIAPHSDERMAQQGLGLTLKSDLVGTELLFPAPLYKSTGTAQSLEISTAFRSDQTTHYWDMSLDDKVHAYARVDDGELASLLMNLGPDRLPDSMMDEAGDGLRVQGRASVFAIDGWAQSIARLIESIPDTGDAPTPTMPISAQLTIDTLQLGSQTLGDAKLRVNSDDTYLNTVLDNHFIKGSVRYPREHWTKQIPAKIRIEHVDTVVINALQSPVHRELLPVSDDAIDPTILPPIDARIVKLIRGEQTLRDIVVRAQPSVSGLEITTLGFAYQNMQLVGQGYWRLRDPQGVNPDLAGKQVTALNLVLQSDNFGQGLEYIGASNLLSEGAGSVEAQLSWPGAAYKPELASLDGNIKLFMERGSIVPLEPGAGRMVGLFALQALPRRLNLDFKDVTADGLAFKRITGDVSIDNGIADVGLVQLTGPIGVVEVVGQSDLKRREFDQRITVLPRVSAALPIIGVISGGASAGVGALVAAGFLKALGIDLDRLGLRDYRLTGTWDAPKIKPVVSDISAVQ